MNEHLKPARFFEPVDLSLEVEDSQSWVCAVDMYSAGVDKMIEGQKFAHRLLSDDQTLRLQITSDTLAEFFTPGEVAAMLAVLIDRVAGQ